MNKFIPNNKLNLEAVKTAIEEIVECAYYAWDPDDLPPKYADMSMSDIKKYLVNEYAESLFKEAKNNMFPISNFRYVNLENSHLVGGEKLFDRPAFLLMIVENGGGKIKQAPSSTITEDPALFEDTCLYMLDNGEVYLIDSMSANLGNRVDVKYSKIRSRLYAQYVEFTLDEFENWLRHAKEKRKPE